MAIVFFNVKSGEKRKVTTEPMIAAFYNSSDQHVNARLGQDHGWRLAPETLRRIRAIQKDPNKMAQLAAQFAVPLDEVSETDVLFYISEQDAAEEARKTEVVEQDFTRQYEDEVRALEDEDKPKTETPPAPRRQAAPKPQSRSQQRRENVQSGKPVNEGLDAPSTPEKADSTNDTDSAKLEKSSKPNETQGE